MSVTELTTDQLDQLKWNLFYGDECVDVTMNQQQQIEGYGFFWDIPDKLVFDVYSGIDFVSDDFF